MEQDAYPYLEERVLFVLMVHLKEQHRVESTRTILHSKSNISPTS